MYATINPNTVNFEKTQLQLENSLGNGSTYFALDKAVKEDNYLITRSSDNGLYRLPIRFTQFNADGIKDKPKTDDDEILYALVAEYETKKLNPETEEEIIAVNKVYSKYDIQFAMSNATASSLPSMTVEVLKNNGNAANISNGAYKAEGLEATLKYENAGGTERGIYKKYIECTGAVNTATNMASDEAVSMMNGMLKTIYGRNDEDFNGVKVAVDAKYSGYTFTFKYYALGYSGKSTSSEFKVNFATKFVADYDMTFTSTPNSASNQTIEEGDVKFGNAPFFADGTYAEWSQKVARIIVKNTSKDNNGNVINGVSGVKFAKKNAAGVEESSTFVSVNSTTPIGNILSQRVMSATYDPSVLTAGKAHEFTMDFLDQNDNVVNTVYVKLTMNIPTTYKVSPIDAMFDGDLTIGWASYNETQNKAEYELSNSFNNVGNSQWVGAVYRFEDVTKYDNNTSAFKLDATSLAGNKIQVSTSAVDKENWTYSIEAGIQYFGLSNLWTNEKSFTLKLQSPIRHASFAFLKNNSGSWVETQAYDVKNGGSLELTDDNIKSLNYKNDAIKYLGTSDSKDALIDKVTIKLADENDPNKGLIESAEVDNGKISIVTKTNGAMVSNAAIKFNIIVEDKFGLETTHQFTLNVLK